MEEAQVLEQTRQWVKQFVIALGLCPFASVPFRENRIRFRVSQAGHAPGLAEDLAAELRYLLASTTEEVETTLLIHPQVLNSFEEYLDFLNWTESLLRDMQLDGILQIASFHPDYQFAGTHSEAVENYTNRSPYPMLHLIREDSISAAVEQYPDIEQVPQRNIDLLNQLGEEAIKAKLDEIRKTN